MTSTAVERIQAEDLQARQVLNRTLSTADVMAASSLVRADLRGKPEDVRAIAITLHQYGLPVGIQNINACYVVKGRVEFMTHLWTGLALRYGGHRVWLDDANDATRATAWIQRGDSGERYSATFTMEDAKRAGLADSETYKKYPQDMLGWRALSRVLKRYAPEVMAGLADAGPETVARARPRSVPAPVVEQDDILDAELVEPGEDPGTIAHAGNEEPEGGRDNAAAEVVGQQTAPAASGPVDWRAKAKAAGMTKGEALSKMQELAGQLGKPAPGSLAEVDEETADFFADWMGE